LYGFRPAAAVWETHYADTFEGEGFIRGESRGAVFYHPGQDLLAVVHGDDFRFSRLADDLLWIRGLMASWFEIKVRRILGGDDEDKTEIDIWGRVVRWTPNGSEDEAGPKHLDIILENFGLDSGTRGLSCNRDKDDKEEEWEKEGSSRDDAK